MINYLKHIYHGWIGLPDSIFIDVSVLFSMRWCCLDKMCSPASFPGLTYLVEVSYFVAFLALCILGCTLLPWLVLWFSTSHTLPFHTWGFSTWLTELKIPVLQNYSVPHSFHWCVLICCSSPCSVYGCMQQSSRKNWN